MTKNKQLDDALSDIFFEVLGESSAYPEDILRILHNHGYDLVPTFISTSAGLPPQEAEAWRQGYQFALAALRGDDFPTLGTDE